MKKKINPKQIAAMICLVLILLSYIVLIAVSLLDSQKSGELFQACLIATVFLPILCWIYIWLYGRIKQRSTIADPDILQAKTQLPNQKDLKNADPDLTGKNPTDRV